MLIDGFELPALRFCFPFVMAKLTITKELLVKSGVA